MQKESLHRTITLFFMTVLCVSFTHLAAGKSSFVGLNKKIAKLRGAFTDTTLRDVLAELEWVPDVMPDEQVVNGRRYDGLGYLIAFKKVLTDMKDQPVDAAAFIRAFAIGKKTVTRYKKGSFSRTRTIEVPNEPACRALSASIVRTGRDGHGTGERVPAVPTQEPGGDDREGADGEGTDDADTDHGGEVPGSATQLPVAGRADGASPEPTALDQTPGGATPTSMSLGQKIAATTAIIVVILAGDHYVRGKKSLLSSIKAWIEEKMGHKQSQKEPTDEEIAAAFAQIEQSLAAVEDTTDETDKRQNTSDDSDEKMAD